jgi:hypothetical protein
VLGPLPPDFDFGHHGPPPPTLARHSAPSSLGKRGGCTLSLAGPARRRFENARPTYPDPMAPEVGPGHTRADAQQAPGSFGCPGTMCWNRRRSSGLSLTRGTAIRIGLGLRREAMAALRTSYQRHRTSRGLGHNL